jgi:DNA-binding response OmpR family regulator
VADYDLVILDLIMPDMDGRHFLAQLLRERREQGVLVLSCLADVTTKVDCLELGAQDYLTKPFSLTELLARVRVRLRADAHPPNEVLKVGDLVLDMGRLEANIGNGPVGLTRLEFLLLRELMEQAGLPVGKGQLLASVWGYDFDPGTNVVDVCVRRLRSKLGFDLIKTVRGEGYQLAR